MSHRRLQLVPSEGLPPEITPAPVPADVVEGDTEFRQWMNLTQRLSKHPGLPKERRMIFGIVLDAIASQSRRAPRRSEPTLRSVPKPEI